MLFHTYTYAVFLPIVLALYAALNPRGRQIMLLAASYVFYCWVTPWYGFLLLGSTLLDYYVGLRIEQSHHLRRRRWWLMVSLVGNLGALGFFKYSNFIGENVFALASLMGSPRQWEPLDIILPVGISFYTFQTISYSIQVYRRQYPAERDFVAFALYVSFFPQLVAGPIERATNLLPQLKRFEPLRWDNIQAGLARITIGLFRKLVIADRMSIVVDGAFGDPASCSLGVVWLALFCFYGQLYFDFSGYADIAIGSARLLGIRLQENFRRPVAASSVIDWWNRWHMTLTGWFRDYLFTTLGGFKRGRLRAALNAAVVMGLCGLWHGAAWHFVLWGLWCALCISANYAVRTYFPKRSDLRANIFIRASRFIAANALVNLLVIIALLLFRSPDFETMLTFASAMIDFNSSGKTFPPYLWIYVAFLFVWYAVEILLDRTSIAKILTRLPLPIRAIGWALLVIVIALGSVDLRTPYLYFKF